jgi:hypothetical protein
MARGHAAFQLQAAQEGVYRMADVDGDGMRHGGAKQESDPQGFGSRWRAWHRVKDSTLGIPRGQAVKGLDEVYRLKGIHKRWVILNAGCGLLPIFAIVNKFQPMLTDGFGGDLLPTLFPDAVGAHYNAILAALLGALAASELFRRRFYRIHEADLKL